MTDPATIEKIARLANTLRVLISWLVRELGQNNAMALLDMLSDRATAIKEVMKDE